MSPELKTRAQACTTKSSALARVAAPCLEIFSPSAERQRATFVFLPSRIRPYGLRDCLVFVKPALVAAASPAPRPGSGNIFPRICFKCMRYRAPHYTHWHYCIRHCENSGSTGSDVAWCRPASFLATAAPAPRRGSGHVSRVCSECPTATQVYRSVWQACTRSLQPASQNILHRLMAISRCGARTTTRIIQYPSPCRIHCLPVRDSLMTTSLSSSVLSVKYPPWTELSLAGCGKRHRLCYHE